MVLYTYPRHDSPKMSKVDKMWLSVVVRGCLSLVVRRWLSVIVGNDDTSQLYVFLGHVPNMNIYLYILN